MYVYIYFIHPNTCLISITNTTLTPFRREKKSVCYGRKKRRGLIQRCGGKEKFKQARGSAATIAQSASKNKIIKNSCHGTETAALDLFLKTFEEKKTRVVAINQLM